MQNQIIEILDRIVLSTKNKILTQKDNNYLGGLYSGEYSILLFLYCYADYFSDMKILDMSNQYLEKLLQRIKFSIATSAYLCDGLSGILYLILLLKEKRFVDVDLTDVEANLDEYLYCQMISDIKEDNYELLYGGVGIGMYFIKKGKSQYFNIIIDELYKMGEKGHFTYKLEAVYSKNKLGNDISFAHGMSGIIPLLTHIYRHNNCPKSKELIINLVNFIISQKIEYEKFGSYFSSSENCNKNNRQIQKSRLSWCNGDLGIANSLKLAGNALNDNTLIELSYKIYFDSMTRLDLSSNYIEDACFCHGSSGAYLFFNKMYKESNIIDYRNAADYWLEKTLNYSCYKDGIGGYKTVIGDRLINDYSLLTGTAGIGLVLLSYLSDNIDILNEVFLFDNFVVDGLPKIKY